MRTRLLALLLVGCGAPDPENREDRETAEDTGISDETSDWHCIDGSWSAESLGDARWRVTTKHYRLTWDGTAEEAEDAARILEMAWLGMRAYWDNTPDPAERLDIGVFADESTWAAALTADGIDVPWGAGGYYWPGNTTAYLHRQPTTYYTQTLLIHEAAHQFHDLATAGLSDLPSWYVEGIAESLGRHDWDGECGRIGRLPVVSRDDIAERALLELDTLDIDALVRSTGAQSRPLSYALVRYLEQTEAHAEAWRRVRSATDAGQEVLDDVFRAELGDPSSLAPGLEAWLATDQEALQPIYLEWLHRRPDLVVGWAPDVSSIAPALPAPESVAFRATWTQGYAGLVSGYSDTENWTALLIRRDGEVSSFVVTGGAVEWTSMGQATLAAGSTAVMWDGAALTVDGAEFPWSEPHPLNGGLALYASEVSFDELELVRR